MLLLGICALLDLIWIAGRESPQDDTPASEIAAAARHLLGLAWQATPQIRFVCYELLDQEWQDNLAAFSKGPHSGLHRAQALLARFDQTAVALAVPTPVY